MTLYTYSMKVSKRSISSAIAFAPVAIVGAIGLVSVDAAAKTNGNAVSSRSLYATHCASCHGSDGRSNTKRGRETEADDISGGISTSKIVRVVTNGKGDMPSFKRKLTAAQIASIARYVAKL
jgi:mono/diheme cytochrome c family protein